MKPFLKRPIPSAKLVDMKLEVREMFPMLDVESEWVVPIHAPDYLARGTQSARNRTDLGSCKETLTIAIFVNFAEP